MTLKSVSDHLKVRDYFKSKGVETFSVGDHIDAKDGSGLQVCRVSLGSAVSTISYVKLNDPYGRVYHANILHR